MEAELVYAELASILNENRFRFYPEGSIYDDYPVLGTRFSLNVAPQPYRTTRICLRQAGQIVVFVDLVLRKYQDEPAYRKTKRDHYQLTIVDHSLYLEWLLAKPRQRAQY